MYKDETTTIEVKVTSRDNASNPVVYSEKLPATVRVRGYNTPGVMLLSSSLIMLAAMMVLVMLLRWRRRR